MIVWLASYPRSGNSLLRQVLWYTMGLPSYTVDFDRVPIGHRLLSEYTRRFEEGESFDSFYARATRAEELFLVKTHGPPPDDHPALYVVRDGRSAIVSFLAYERTFSPQTSPSMLSLIAGDHLYGSWSEHFYTWKSRTASTMTIRYPDLFDADAGLCSEIASFVRYEGPVSSWTNPTERSHGSGISSPGPQRNACSRCRG